MRASIALSALLVLAGCGSKKDPTLMHDDALDQALEAGHDALVLGRYSVAEGHYRDAAKLAFRRDDAKAISDAGYDLAVTLLADGNADAALNAVNATRQNLALRGMSDTPADLDLVAAASLHRLKRDAEAAPIAARAMGSPSPQIAAHAAFISGLIADARGDQATLQAAATQIGGMKPPFDASIRADRAELQAMAALKQNPDLASTLAADATRLRRDTGDYRGVARTLDLQARAEQALGHDAAARALWARAAQSVAAHDKNDPEAADWARAAGYAVPLEPFAGGGG